MKMRKLLAAMLAVLMLLTMLPVAAFAAEDTITVYFRNKRKVTFNGEEILVYHFYSDDRRMVSADDIDVSIYDDSHDSHYFFDILGS